MFHTSYVYAVLVISLLALGIAWALRAQVLSNSEGTENMKEIAAAVQEGAAAYLSRQFRTLSYFVGIVFFLLFALPGSTEVRVGRSVFFLIGAAFSALVGYNGMWLAVRANVRVAEAARQKSSENAVKIAFRTGGVVGMTTVGLGLLGGSLVVALYKDNAPAVIRGEVPPVNAWVIEAVIFTGNSITASGRFCQLLLEKVDKSNVICPELKEGEVTYIEFDSTAVASTGFPTLMPEAVPDVF